MVPFAPTDLTKFSFVLDNYFDIVSLSLPKSTGIDTIKAVGLTVPTDTHGAIMSALYHDFVAEDVVRFFSNTPMTILIWSTDGSIDQPYSNFVARKIEQAYVSKTHTGIPKSLWYDLVEFAWIAYEDTGDCIFAHHNQLNGIIKDGMSKAMKRQWHRYALDTLISMLPDEKKPHIYAPTNFLYNDHYQQQLNEGVCFEPYGSRVMKHCGMVRVELDQMFTDCPIAADRWVGPTDTYTVWKYQSSETSSISHTRPSVELISLDTVSASGP